MQKDRKVLIELIRKIMNRKVLKAAFIVAIAMVSGVNVFNFQKPIELSDIAMANVEALANLENDDPVVGGTTGSCTEVCYKCDGWMCTRIYNGETSRCVHYRKIQ